MQNTNEDLRKWFREKWVNLAKKKKGGGYAPCGTSGEKKGYAKCVPAAKAASMSKDEIKSAIRRKRAAQSAAGRPGKDQPGQGNAPIMVKTMKEESLQEKNTPTNPKLWARAKSLAKSKFDVYPSAYANGWAAKWYRGKGGGWRSTNESTDQFTEELGKDNEWGTPELTKKMMSMTPGQGKKMRTFKEFSNNTLDKYDDKITLDMRNDLDLEKNDTNDVKQRKYRLKDYSAANDYEREETGGETDEYLDVEEAASPAWQRKEGKNPEGGLNKKGIASYRRQNPGSKLSLAVTTEPSKLKKGSKSWKRRKSFCARMKGMKKRLTSAETANDPDSRINKSLRKWNC
jgi:hypothetical protein